MTTLTIKVNSTKITAELVGELQNLALGKIELEIPGPPNYVCNPHLWLLSGLPIARLDLAGTCITSAGLEALRGLPLTSLNLEGQQDIDSSGLEVLRGMSLLTSLNLDSCYNIGNQGLAMLRGLPITQLNLSRVYFNVTLEGVEAALKDICIESIYRTVLAGLPVAKLRLSWCFNDGILLVLPLMPQLVDLSIDGRGNEWYRGSFTDVDLQGLRGLSLQVFSSFCKFVRLSRSYSGGPRGTARNALS